MQTVYVFLFVVSVYFNFRNLLHTFLFLPSSHHHGRQHDGFSRHTEISRAVYPVLPPRIRQVHLDVTGNLHQGSFSRDSSTYSLYNAVSREPLQSAEIYSTYELRSLP